MEKESMLIESIKKYQERIGKCGNRGTEFIFGGSWYDDDSDFRPIKRIIEDRMKQDEQK